MEKFNTFFEIFSGTWNAQICDALRPEPQDVVIIGKHGLSAFPNTDLEQQLKTYGIETLALAGFMANCCVESTMREACDKGFDVITLTDCVATTSMAGIQLMCFYVNCSFFVVVLDMTILDEMKKWYTPMFFRKKYLK